MYLWPRNIRFKPNTRKSTSPTNYQSLISWNFQYRLQNLCWISPSRAKAVSSFPVWNYHFPLMRITKTETSLISLQICYFLPTISEILFVKGMTLTHLSFINVKWQKPFLQSLLPYLNIMKNAHLQYLLLDIYKLCHFIYYREWGCIFLIRWWDIKYILFTGLWMLSGLSIHWDTLYLSFLILHSGKTILLQIFLKDCYQSIQNLIFTPLPPRWIWEHCTSGRQGNVWLALNA